MQHKHHSGIKNLIKLMNDPEFSTKYNELLKEPSHAWRSLRDSIDASFERISSITQQIKETQGDPELVPDVMLELAIFGYIINQHSRMGEWISDLADPHKLKIATDIDNAIDAIIQASNDLANKKSAQS